jgi:hypothetical protein
MASRFRFTVHHKRAIAHNRLIQRFAGHQQHFGIAVRFQMQFVAFLTQDDQLGFTRLRYRLP